MKPRSLFFNSQASIIMHYEYCIEGVAQVAESINLATYSLNTI